MTDFSQPGNDGTLPADFRPWRWCVTYTVRPDFLSPLRYGREYIIVSRVVRRSVIGDVVTNYSSLYDRAIAIAKARVERLSCYNADNVLHSRIVTHGWYRNEQSNIASAFVGIGILCLRSGDPKPQGISSPIQEELATPSVMTE